MDYNLAGIRNRVINDKLDDPDYDTGIVNRFINDAQRSIFNQYELPYQETNDVLVISNGTELDLPDDYQMLQSLVITSPTDRRRDLSELYVDFRDFNARFYDPTSDSKGAPSSWTIYAQQLMFSRPVDQTYNISIFYLRTPALLDDDASIPEIPEEYAELLVLGAYYRVLQRNEDFDQASFIENGEYQRLLDSLVARYGKRQTAKAMTMRQPQNYTRRRSTRA